MTHGVYFIDLNRFHDPADAGRLFAMFVTGQIPIVAEIEPQPDPVLGHTFKWPAGEIDNTSGGEGETRTDRTHRP